MHRKIMAKCAEKLQKDAKHYKKEEKKAKTPTKKKHEKIEEKEASETAYWLEVLNGSKLLDTDILSTSSLLLKEARELLAIFNSISSKVFS